MNTEERIAKLEEEVRKLKTCSHVWIMSRNGCFPKVFHNGCNSYIQCEKCGKKQLC